MGKSQPLWGRLLELTWQFLFYIGFGFSSKTIVKFLIYDVFGGDVRFAANLLLSFTKFFAGLTAFTFYSTLYYIHVPFFEKYRLQEWVWDKKETNRTKGYMTIFWKTVGSFLVGELISSIGIYYICVWIIRDKTEEELLAYFIDEAPGHLENFLRIFAGCVFFEVIFYLGHLFLHTKIGYPFHKDHHAFYVTTSAAGSWGHIVDGLISFPIPGALPILLFNFHWYTTLNYMIILSFHSHYDHGGYDFPFNPFQLIPFGSNTAEHNFHHSHLHSNFALNWTFLDKIFGTDKLWVKHLADEEEERRALMEGKEVANRILSHDNIIITRAKAEDDDIIAGNDNLSYSLRSVDAKLADEIANKIEGVGTETGTIHTTEDVSGLRARNTNGTQA